MSRVRPKPVIILYKREAKIINKMIDRKKYPMDSLGHSPRVEKDITEIQVKSEVVGGLFVIIYAKGNRSQGTVINKCC